MNSVRTISSVCRSVSQGRPTLQTTTRVASRQLRCLSEQSTDRTAAPSKQGTGTPGAEASNPEHLRPVEPQAPLTTSSQETPMKNMRFPRSVQALYLKPLRREAEYGIPSCDLQLRSFSITNLEFFADFALRAAYYLNLPAYGPVPLPRITERWTVPRSSFIFKKSQENFERVTLRRMIQIRDGHPETVQLWLAFLQKHAYYGVGMKANVWEFSAQGVGKSMGEVSPDVSQIIGSKWEHLAQNKTIGTMQKVEELLTSRKFKTIADEHREAGQWDAIRKKQAAAK